MYSGYTDQGIIAPFKGADPTGYYDMSPYRTSMRTFIADFGYTLPRLDILEGLLNYRDAIRAIGVTGVQWLGGSFLEDVEKHRQRPPGDIDVISIIKRPAQMATDALWSAFAEGPDGYLFFDPHATKDAFKCDAYIIDLQDEPEDVVGQSRYWFGLFSHQRITYFWKGMMVVDLDAQQDVAARGMIADKRRILNTQSGHAQ